MKDDDRVKEYMENLDHPLKAGIEAVRSIIKKVDKRIGERIKWNAPSYYCSTVEPTVLSRGGGEDMVTFNLRATKHVHLVFHHPAIVKIQSELLEGTYKDRRMMYFNNLADVKKNKKELERIMKELIEFITFNNL